MLSHLYVFEDPELSCFDNYIQLWKTLYFGRLKNNLIWLALFSLSPIVGLALALFFHVKSPVASIYKSLFFAPMVFSLVVVGMIWGWFMQPQFGLLDHLLKFFGVIGPDTQFDFLTRLSWESTLCVIIAACTATCLLLYDSISCRSIKPEKI